MLYRPGQVQRHSESLACRSARAQSCFLRQPKDDMLMMSCREACLCFAHVLPMW